MHFPRMGERLRLPRSTTRPRNIRPAQCAIRLFTVRTQINSSSSHKEEAMRQGKSTRSLQAHSGTGATVWAIGCAIVLLFVLTLLPPARAQQQEEQKGIEQGN